MEPTSYRTIQAPTEGLYREKGSKFLAFAYPVANEQEVKRFLEVLKKKYFDAKHHCYAYILGPPAFPFRAFDAGEPNHSAGDPILGKIRSNNLQQVLVVVIRYFGGVKLGVGGLVKAYKAAAEEALKRVVVIERDIKQTYRLTYNYGASSETMRLVKEFDLKILKHDYLEGGSMELEVAIRNLSQFLEKIKLLNALNVDIRVFRIEIPAS